MKPCHPALLRRFGVILRARRFVRAPRHTIATLGQFRRVPSWRLARLRVSLKKEVGL